MKKSQILSDQRGIGMLVELMLLGVVIAAFAIIGMRSYQSRQAALNSSNANSQKSNVARSATDTAINALTQSTLSESALTIKEDDDSSQVKATATAAGSLSGGLDEAAY